MTSLFDAGKIGTLELPNRIIRSATYEGMASREGYVTPEMRRLYLRSAKGGVGLSIIAYASVHYTSRAFWHQCRIDRDDFVPKWRELVDEVHAEGGKVALQIAHSGRASDPKITGVPALAPSPVRNLYTMNVPREITEPEIWEMIEAFGSAAVRAKEAGFDAVQLHFAHGYLPSQFLSPFTNRRDDDWGGDSERRQRFMLEVYRQTRRDVGPDYPLFAKFNMNDYVRNGITVEDAIPVAQILAAEGIDALELSGGFGDSPFNIMRGDIPNEIAHSFNFLTQFVLKVIFHFMRRGVRFEREAYFLPDALKLRQAVPDIPLILVGGLRSRAVMQDVLDKGFEFVAMARPLIREPNLPKRMKAGKTDAATCISCNKCLVEMRRKTGIKCVWKGD